MSAVKYDLTIRLDESANKLVFFTTRRSDETNGNNPKTPEFSVEISLDELKEKGGTGAERLIGKSVIGFFDHLTDGRLDLPKHYLD